MKCFECQGACCEEFSLDLVFSPPSPAAMEWIKLHAIRIEGESLTFETRCTQLQPNGSCGIWEDRPLVCELYLPGGPACLEVVKRRRTANEYQQIRDIDDPDFL